MVLVWVGLPYSFDLTLFGHFGYNHYLDKELNFTAFSQNDQNILGIWQSPSTRTCQVTTRNALLSLQKATIVETSWRMESTIIYSPNHHTTSQPWFCWTYAYTSEAELSQLSFYLGEQYERTNSLPINLHTDENDETRSVFTRHKF